MIFKKHEESCADIFIRGMTVDMFNQRNERICIEVNRFNTASEADEIYSKRLRTVWRREIAGQWSLLQGDDQIKG